MMDLKNHTERLYSSLNGAILLLSNQAWSNEHSYKF